MTDRPCLWPPCPNDAAVGEVACDEHRARVSRMTEADIIAAIAELDRLYGGGLPDPHWLTPTERQRVVA